MFHANFKNILTKLQLLQWGPSQAYFDKARTLKGPVTHQAPLFHSLHLVRLVHLVHSVYFVHLVSSLLSIVLLFALFFICLINPKSPKNPKKEQGFFPTQPHPLNPRYQLQNLMFPCNHLLNHLKKAKVKQETWKKEDSEYHINWKYHQGLSGA